MAAASKSLSFLQPLFVSLARPSSSSSSSLALSRARTIAVPNPLFSANSRSLSSVAFAQSTNENGSGGGGGAIAPPQTLVAEELQRIDVNPPKGTRDFPPEEMRLRNWLFQNFREVSSVSQSASFVYYVLILALTRTKDLLFFRFRDCLDSKRSIFRCLSRKLCTSEKLERRLESRSFFFFNFLISGFFFSS